MLTRSRRRIAALSVPFALGACALAFGQANRPNIIYFLADDMGIGDTSAYWDINGNSAANQIDTPNLERLASRGTRFTDVHCPAALCTPTRLSLLSGVASHRTPMKQATSIVGQDIEGTLLPGTRETVGGMLQNAGYGTYGIGKWHMAMQVNFTAHTIAEGPVQSGFDHYTGTPGNFPGGAGQGIVRDNTLLTYNSSFQLVPFSDPSAQPWDPDNNRAQTEHIQQTNLDAAQDYLATHVSTRAQDPFFLYYASHSNHTPYIAGAQLDGVTIDGHNEAGTYLPVPTTTTGTGAIIPTGSDYGSLELDTHWDPYLQTDASGNVIRHGPGERARSVDENDIALGKLLDYLDTTDDPRNPGHKLVDNTLVIFAADNGADMKAEPPVGKLPQSSNGVLTGINGKKATFFEGGTRTPFIAAWAGQIPAGATSNALFTHTDFFATVADIIDVDLAPTQAADSISALAALKGTVSGDYRSLPVIYKNDGDLIIRMGELKLVATDPVQDNLNKFDGQLDFQNLQVKRFFNLATDLGETVDLKNNAAYAATIAQLLSTVQAFVDQGFSRVGAVPVMNGTSFQGGNLLATGSYFSYGDGGTFEIPKLTETNPNFVYVDGTAAARVTNAWIIQGGGSVNFTGGGAGLTNSNYELRGGTITSASAAFQVNSGSYFWINGGSLNLGTLLMRQELGDSLIEISRGSASAGFVTIGNTTGATDGSKIIRFTKGTGGTLSLSDANPLRYGNDGSTTNDYVDFVTGSRGKIVAPATTVAYFQTLYTNGRLCVNDVASTALPLQFADYFYWTTTGSFELSLRRVAGLRADFNNSGALDTNDIDLLFANYGTPKGTFDLNGDATVNLADVTQWVTVEADTQFGDTNLDGRVNFDDLLRLAANYNSSTSLGWASGNFNGDPNVNFDDLLLLAANYNFVSPGASVGGDWALAGAVVPEPASLALSLGGLIALRRTRRAAC